ncbi:hypothetical protein STEG23_003787 [Scotinomys teguina]
MSSDLHVHTVSHAFAYTSCVDFDIVFPLTPVLNEFPSDSPVFTSQATIRCFSLSAGAFAIEYLLTGRIALPKLWVSEKASKSK